MIDFTKLRDLIVEKKCVSSNDYGKEDPFIGIYWEDLIDIINQCDSEKWISVDEALPEKIKDKNYSKYVLTRQEYYEHEYYVIARYDYNFKMWVSTNYFKPEFITHWAPIPSLEGGE